MNVHYMVLGGEEVDITEHMARMLRKARVWLARCPVCPEERGRGEEDGVRSWFYIVRRNHRAMTIRCRTCVVQFTITYRNLLKGIEGFHKLAVSQSGGTYIRNDDENVDRQINDLLDIRGRGLGKLFK